MATARAKIINVVYLPKWTDLPDGGAIMEFMPDARLAPRTRSAAGRHRSGRNRRSEAR